MTSSLWEVEQSRRLPDKSHSEMVSQWIPLDSSLDQASCLSYDVRQLWTTAGLFLGYSEFCLNSTKVHTATLVTVSPCQLLLCSRLAKTRRPFSHMPHRHHVSPISAFAADYLDPSVDSEFIPVNFYLIRFQPSFPLIRNCQKF